ncbi:unnamed protein product [Cylicocyclus nassatus]|uniref:MSP domain-containing protein n=1 Tax=Cylicocyclus nassatus TaxID=53992 RepID=A0AA36GQC5_CYLNA|nr:unnamed protein product [Cylicocyclus nassatus]
MSLTANPSAADFAASGGASSHTLTNCCKDRLIFKIKSSNNTSYRVNPVFGILGPGAKTTVEITRQGGPVKEDKIVVNYAQAPTDATDAQVAYRTAETIGNITIPIFVK